MARSIFGTANNFISSSSKYNTIVFYKIVHATSREREGLGNLGFIARANGSLDLGLESFHKNSFDKKL